MDRLDKSDRLNAENYVKNLDDVNTDWFNIDAADLLAPNNAKHRESWGTDFGDNVADAVYLASAPLSIPANIASQVGQELYRKLRYEEPIAPENVVLAGLPAFKGKGHTSSLLKGLEARDRKLFDIEGAAEKRAKTSSRKKALELRELRQNLMDEHFAQSVLENHLIDLAESNKEPLNFIERTIRYGDDLDAFRRSAYRELSTKQPSDNKLNALQTARLISDSKALSKSIPELSKSVSPEYLETLKQRLLDAEYKISDEIPWSTMTQKYGLGEFLNGFPE